MYPRIFGKYLLEREIAQGGMAVVHLATLRGAEGFEKRLVVKQIREEYAEDRDFIERFVREAKTNVSLNHPNIVTIYELGLERGTYFIAMEYVEGASISEILGCAKEGRLTPREGAFVGKELARALDYAHRKMQVIHRDVTPRNVVVDEEGQVKLIDFGIAARVKGTKRETFGSPGHMAPEQHDGGELGPATDLFALAALLLEIWSGVAPFRRTTEEACREAVFASARPKPSDADPALAELDPIFERALALLPSERPSFAEFEEALAVFVAKLDPGTVLRDLGLRARHAREELAHVPTPKAGISTLPKAGGETRTFATRPIEPPKALTASVEAGAPAPSTRRLPEAPQVAEEPGSEEGSPGASASAENVDERREKGARDRSSGGATAEGAPTRVGLPYVMTALVALGGLSYLALARSRVAPGKDLVPASSRPAEASTREVPVLEASVSTASPSEETVAPTAGAISALASIAPPNPRGSSAPRASVVALPKGGTIRFVGEPGTVLFVDGRRRGVIPTSAALDVGPHEVRLLFEPTGESHGETVQMGSGDRLLIRSTFSGARPELHVERDPHPPL